jgi:hypothetical protein
MKGEREREREKEKEDGRRERMIKLGLKNEALLHSIR